MKRGFLLRAEAKKAAAKRRTAQKDKEKDPSAASVAVSQPDPGIDLKTTKLPYGNLTEEQKALPSDYKPLSTNFQEADPKATEYLSGTLVVSVVPQPIPDGETPSIWIVNGSTKGKVLNAPGYPARIPQPRRPDLYQVSSTPDMGQGVFAKRDIKRGDIIFAERPLLVSPQGIRSFRDDSIPDHYTPQQIQQIMMRDFEETIAFAIGRLSTESQADFRALHNAHTGDGSGPLLSIMRSNGYGIQSLYDGSKKDASTSYGAVCKIGSRLNHSCSPNVGYYFKINSFSMQFYAKKNIKAGEQLFYTYCSAGSLAKRQAELAPYGFECKCPACVNATPETDKLRSTFSTTISRLSALATSTSKINETDIEEAVKLEKAMVKEGLDTEGKFIELAVAIGIAYAKLGKIREGMKYSDLAEQYGKGSKEDE